MPTLRMWSVSVLCSTINIAESDNPCNAIRTGMCVIKKHVGHFEISRHVVCVTTAIFRPLNCIVTKVAPTIRSQHPKRCCCLISTRFNAHGASILCQCCTFRCLFVSPSVLIHDYWMSVACPSLCLQELWQSWAASNNFGINLPRCQWIYSVRV